MVYDLEGPLRNNVAMIHCMYYNIYENDVYNLWNPIQQQLSHHIIFIWTAHRVCIFQNNFNVVATHTC